METVVFSKTSNSGRDSEGSDVHGSDQRVNILIFEKGEGMFVEDNKNGSSVEDLGVKFITLLDFDRDINFGNLNEVSLFDFTGDGRFDLLGVFGVVLG